MEAVPVVTVIVVLLVLLVARVPVAFSLLVSGAVGITMLQSIDYAIQSVATSMFSGPAVYTLIVIPLFIAMGVYAKHGTLAEDGFALAFRLLHRLPGGAAMATVLACGFFAAVSGSSVATVASLGPISIREMRKRGYDTTFAAGVVGSAGTLGVLIPPSVLLVMFGVVAGESIGALLVAGIIPGIISVLAFMVAILYRGWRHPALIGAVKEAESLAEEERLSVGIGGPGAAPGRRHATSTFTSAAKGSDRLDGRTEEVDSSRVRQGYAALRLLLLFGAVMGGIYFGFFTPTEAAAIGALIAFLFMLVDTRLRRTSASRAVHESTSEAVSITSMTMTLLIGASVFTFFLVLARVPTALTDWITALTVPAPVVVLIMLLVFVPMGMFLDSLTMIIITIPIFMPVINELGYEGIWFGILVVKMCEIGLLTPPFGLNAFVVAGTSQGLVSVPQAFRGVLRFVAVDVSVVAVLFAFPALSLWLPEVAGF